MKIVNPADPIGNIKKSLLCIGTFDILNIYFKIVSVLR